MYPVGVNKIINKMKLIYNSIPGMDFAHVMNGYRYHTKYDHIDYIPPAVLQRTGDNILALVKLIASSDQLANTKVGNTLYII